MSMTLVAPHEETLFYNADGTLISSVTISKDVSEFDAIRVFVTKKDGSNWNVACSEAPVLKRSSVTGAYGTATVHFSPNDATDQLVSFAWALKSGQRNMDFSAAQYVNFTHNYATITAGHDTNLSIVVFRVIGIRYQ